ncbi:MAG: porin family protein, partial [Bacteroidales bacterium]
SCLLALVLSSYAQKKIGKELFLGVKGGTTWSRLSITPKIKQQFEFGYISGVSMRYIEERFFGIIVELNFAQHGWKGTFEEKDSNYAYSRKLNYIELPFLAHIYFGKKAFRFFVNLGPQIGLCIGESASANFDTQNPPKFTIQRETEQYK